jgi:glycosyltransferase involved in cell wall biosynthesis
MGQLRDDNRIVHGMWYGTVLSRLELLTMHSFVECGHDFHLWAYDDLSGYAFPAGVVLRDANEIIPRQGVFAKREVDRETGVGRGSVAAPFSDLFRYRLLLEHGGIWADMDVTCLRPLDFEGPYAFRPHRVGVVGSILKAPANSELIQRAYEETAARVGPDSEYLLPNRILSATVFALGLERWIDPHMTNPDHWHDFVLPMISGPVVLPREWKAIHWINEMFRTLEANEGEYRGRVGEVPDKNNPRAWSLLWEMYRRYQLIDPREEPAVERPRPVFLGSRAPSMPVRSAPEQYSRRTTLNLLIPSLVRGGAERIVLDIVHGLADDEDVQVNLFVLVRAGRSYPLPSGRNLRVTFGHDPEDFVASVRRFAGMIAASPLRRVYSHLMPPELLQPLWDYGVETIPVFHNVRPGWMFDPAELNAGRVPLCVAVSDAVARDLKRSGLRRPVVAIRHELQRRFDPEELARWRRETRARLGVDDQNLLIGMVGQFKSQKAYTRAVRVLAEIRQAMPAKLVIAGGWDHDYGSGRIAYESMCRLAVELGVIADIIVLGDTQPIDPYYAAFDVFLNTSIYEGLSVAMLEAVAAGCPVVTADAGGNKEVAGANVTVLGVDASAVEYADAILRLAGSATRHVPGPPPCEGLIPKIWALLSRYGVPSERAERAGTLFMTENLQTGGPQSSLVNLLSVMDGVAVAGVCAMEGEPGALHKERLDQELIPVISFESFPGLDAKAQAALAWIERLAPEWICFWNLRPELKLLLTKLLALTGVRVCDVSPGPMYFDELADSSAFQHRLALPASAYLNRLDAFVSKYRDGTRGRGIVVRNARVIRNGMPAPPSFIPLPPPRFYAARARRGLAIGTCCRIVPDKKIEFLLETMRRLNKLVEGASLTIVGGPDGSSGDYFEQVKAAAWVKGLHNVSFVGEQEDVLPFLAQLDVFMLVGDRQGCPNAGLEAMAMGLPLLVFGSGGASEQLIEGENGYIVKDAGDAAAKLALLHGDSRKRRRMGKRSKRLWEEEFTLGTMGKAYAELFT